MPDCRLRISLRLVAVRVVLLLSVLGPVSRRVVVAAFSTDHPPASPPKTMIPPPRRNLPEKVIVGYTTRCSEKVLRAVREGVNVVIWAFMDMVAEFDHTHNEHDDNENVGTTKPRAVCVPRIDPLCAKRLIDQLDAEGYDDTVHLVSFGGWNGAHLPDNLEPEAMYASWKHIAGDVFHGIDWDLEGHDQLDAPTNTFSVECLNAVGVISELAKNDGYLVGMSPPQSYLDVSSGSFSRSVNWTDPDPERADWHADFHYFGRNVYAYWLARYGDSIDFVSVQFYESYSRAGLEVLHEGVPPETYLERYVSDPRRESFRVDFGSDPSLSYPSRAVGLPLSKLVLGFANGWGASPDGDKVCYFDPRDIGAAYASLEESDRAPRGFMFWVIDEEGMRGIHFARALNDILNIRTKPQDNAPMLETEGMVEPE